MTKIPSQKNGLSKVQWMTIAAITVVFGGAYFVLRALPDAQCGFLHYEEIVLEDGTVEFCATNHAGFLDLSRLEYPVRTELTFSESPEVGQAQQVSMLLETSGEMPIAPHELAQTHTKKMHLMVIDPSLEDYHHIHPEPDGIDGRYRFDFTPTKAGAYRFFTEVVPLITRRQLIAQSEQQIGEGSSAPVFEEQTRISEVGGVRFEIQGLPETLKRGVDYRLILRISGVDGQPVELEEIMGALGHMVAFDGAGLGFAHMHPEDSVASAVRTAGLGGGAASKLKDLGFIFNVPNAGWYRLFAQIQIGGQEVFGRFDVKVE